MLSYGGDEDEKSRHVRGIMSWEIDLSSSKYCRRSLGVSECFLFSNLNVDIVVLQLLRP